jgi:DNA-binding transcriptional LysR family regulator
VRIVEATRNFKHQAEGLRKEVSGELVFGLNNPPNVLRLVPILATLTERHPALTYDLVAGSSGVILQGLDEGSISVGFFEGACTNPRITVHPLATMDLCLVAPKAWAEELAAPDWKLLGEKPWIFVSPIEQIGREQGLELKARFRANEDLTALSLVTEGLGLSITSRGQIADYPQRDGLFVLPHFHASLPLCLGYLSSRADDPAVRAVRDAVLEIWAKPETTPAVPTEITVRLDTPVPLAGRGRGSRTEGRRRVRS